MKECPKCQRCFADQVNHCPTDGDALKFTIVGDTMLDGRYQLESRLGQGGMGAVFRARHIFLKTHHAIKIILPDLVGNDPSLITRFRQEAMAAAAIRHPNIIAVTDFGVVNGTMPFLVMEFIQGRSLHDMLNQQKRLPPEQALEIMSGVVAGLGAAHRQDIVHRDLKPLNIMLREDAGSLRESVKLLDFGLAKIKSGELLGSFVAAQTTGLMGSPFYMAPEQWGEEEPDRRADIYSLGVILYQMLAGVVPFKGGNIPSIMKKHLTSAPPSFTTQGLQVSPAVEAAVRHALEKEPEDRPQTVEEFIEELQAALAAPPAVFADTLPDANVGMSTVSINSQAAPPHVSQPSQGSPPRQATGEHADGQTTGVVENVGGGGTVHIGGTGSPFNTREPQATGAHPRPQETRADLRGEGVGNATSMMEPSAGASQRTNLEIPRGAETGAHLANQTAYQQQGVAEDSLQARGGRQDRETEPADHTVARGSTGATTDSTADEETFVRVPGARREDAAAGQQVERRGGGGAAFRAVVPVESFSEKKKSRAPVAALAALGVLLLVGAVAGAVYVVRRQSDDNTNGANVNNANVGGTTTPPASVTKPDLVKLPGGSFKIGRDDVPAFTADSSPAYLQHMYTQWPAHAVTLAPFEIDKTEVTNAEYAEFIALTRYVPPPDWGGNQPPAAQEKWPVVNVTPEDIRRFAAWRSKRDGVEYRLPTEDEWEYAARGGDASRIYPWDKDWSTGRANLDGTTVKPVGSHPDGATPQGAHDMIGNVWEWTSTEASIYKGNTRLRLAPADEGKVVVRGGSYESRVTGDTAISATARRWVARDTKDPLIGFRLVRASEQRQ